MRNDFYEDNAEKFVASTINVDISDLRKRFLNYVRSQGKILDAGCGSGRDGLAFKKMGAEVIAFDASAKMVAIASDTLGQSVLHLAFEDISFSDDFDGIWACASLLHVPKADLLSVFMKLSKALKLGGVMYVSFKYGNQERINDDGRYFVDLDEGGLADLLAQISSLEIVELWQTRDHRPGRASEMWLNGILRKKDKLL